MSELSMWIHLSSIFSYRNKIILCHLQSAFDLMVIDYIVLGTHTPFLRPKY